MSKAGKCENETAALGRALVAAAVGGAPLSADDQDVLSNQTCFPAASSLRMALPVGREANLFVLVSGDLRAPRHPPTYWATCADRSLVGRTLSTGRTAAAEGPRADQLVDLRHLAAIEGSGSFLCVPILAEEPLSGLEPVPAVAALLLCYPSTAEAPQHELRLALLLAVQLMREHGQELELYGDRLHLATHPTEHSQWGPGVGPDYPELPLHGGSSPYSYSSDSSGDGDASGAGSPGSDAAGPSRSGSGELLLPAEAAAAAAAAGLRGGAEALIPAAASRRWAISARTLRFADDRTERRFQRWRNTRLAKVDAAALLALLLYHVSACMLPPTSGCSPLEPGSSLPAALTVLVPLLLLLSNRSQRWYSRHRDQLLVCTYLLLACHQALDASPHALAAAAVPVGLWRWAMLHVDFLWGIALAVILQVQFVGHCLMLVGAVALRALVQPGCVERLTRRCELVPTLGLSEQSAAPSCLLDGLARPLLLNVVLPCGLAYYTELSARRNFCAAMIVRQSSRRQQR